jgi:hypothetical protein
MLHQLMFYFMERTNNSTQHAETIVISLEYAC